MRNRIDLIHHGGSSFQRRVGKLTVALSFGLMLVLLLVGCSISRAQTSGSTATGSSPTAVASTPTSTSAASSTSTPTTTTPTPSATTSIGTPSSTPATSATPTSSDVAAIKAVIQRGNQEQAQALAARNPALMRDTSTPSYYTQLVQIQNSMVSAGISSIKLVKLTWGTITLTNATTARATDVETWNTTFANGSTQQQANTNIYTLVLQGGTWKIQADQQPNTPQSTPSTASNPSGNPNPVVPIAPAAPAGGAGQSENWAGYAATGGSFTAVSGSWTVPQVSPSSTPGADATWVGIGGVTSTDLIQAGTVDTVQGGQVTYAAWIETLPQAQQTVPLPVAAGDHVSVSIAQQPSGIWQIVIRNTTAGRSYQTSLSYASSNSSAEWVEEAPAVGFHTTLPLDNFGSINFKSATTVVNGRQETVQQAGGQAITMDNNDGQVLVQPSALGSDGASFTVTRTSAPSSEFGRGFRRNYP